MTECILRRCLARHSAPVDIRGEYSDRPDHHLVARIDVDGSTDIGAMDSKNYEPYLFALLIDDVVVAFDTYHYVTDATRKWNTLADIFGYPYVDYDGYTLHVANSPDEPVPAA